MKHISIKLKGSVLALAACFSTAASAGMDVGTSLTDLRYRVVDLDLQDGIDAAVTFHTADTLFTLYDYSRPWAAGGTPVPVTGSIFAAKPTSFDGGPGKALAEVTATGYRLSASMQTSQLLSAQLLAEQKAQLEAPYSSGASLHLAGAQVSSSNFDGLHTRSNVQWTLAPNTALIVEGNLEATATMDLSDLDRSLLHTYVDELGGYLDVRAYMSTEAYLQTEDARGESQWQTAFRKVDRTLSWGQAGDAVLIDQSSQPGSGPFSLRMDNTSRTAMTGYLGFSSSLFAGSHIGGLLNEPAPSVPEPSTWAFSLAGLAAMGLWLRLRRT